MTLGLQYVSPNTTAADKRAALVALLAATRDALRNRKPTRGWTR